MSSNHVASVDFSMISDLHCADNSIQGWFFLQNRKACKQFISDFSIEQRKYNFMNYDIFTFEKSLEII
jgi:hypothetical protein